MDFSLTEEQLTVRDVFRAFAESDVRPVAAELDRNPRFPAELFLRAGELGLFGMRYPPPDGTGADLLSYLLAVEEIARASLSVAAACSMQSLMGTFFIQRSAQGDVRERLLAPALRGEVIGAICMTEPDAGSDLFSMTTRAVETKGEWRVTGQKTWVTSAPVAHMFTVFARTGEQEISIFLVEKGAPGLQIGRDIDKMGVRASLTSEVSFDDAPAACMLGERGAGMESLREILCEIRLMTAALALGVGRAAFEDALAYSKQRQQFGRPICEFQAVQAHLAEMRTGLEAARSLTLWAAWSSMQGVDSNESSSMAKLFASETAIDVCDRACRVMASYGYAKEYPVERYLRDARFTLIGGGTSEILRGNLARGLVR
ncbi:MAG: acyl-CoA dehydrogenase family protein [Planctomycetes bacterium]|nr:acyl-CoA dehydrogenase family protein [Planctomycetota bacterium]